MKKALTFLMILALFLCGCAKEPAAETQLPTQEETAPTETVPVETAAPVETVTVWRMTRMAALEADGSERWHMEYTYDEYGRISSEKEILYNGEESYAAAFSYVETESSLEIYRTTSSEDENLIRRETWDEQGNLVLCEYIDAGEVEYYTQYVYDEQSRLIEDTTYYVFESAVSRNQYTYDEAGNQTAVYRYNRAELEDWTELTYDANGRLISTVSYDADGAVRQTSTCQWEDNICTQSWYNGEGILTWMEINTYDDGGNIIRAEDRNGDGCSSVNEYTYQQITIIK